MGDEFRLTQHDVGEFGLERTSNLPMKLLSPGFEQTFISDVADEGVLERVRRVGWLAAPKDEFCQFKSVQRRGQRRSVAADQFVNERVRELTSDGRADLRDFLNGFEPIEPRHK